MNAFLMKGAFALQDLLAMPVAALAARSLDATGDPAAQQVAEAVRDAFFRRPSERETAALLPIESLRAELEASDETLAVMDFGADAASPDGTETVRRLGDVTLSSSKPARWASLLFYLVERIVPDRCLEFGTCVGISTMYQSAALSLNGQGAIVTMEGAEALAGVAARNFASLGCRNIVQRTGRFRDVLPGVLTEFGPFDLVFIDGHHEGTATLGYLDAVLPYVSRNAVLAFDDIHWSGSMRDAWRAIVRHPRTKHSVDLYQVGIVIVS